MVLLLTKTYYPILKQLIDNVFGHSFNRFHNKALPMTIREFNQLEKRKQHRLFLKRGVFIASRETEENCISLYQLDGFYIEVFFDLHCTTIIRVRAFEDTNELSPYLAQIEIPDVY